MCHGPLHASSTDDQDFRARRTKHDLAPIINPLPAPPEEGEEPIIKTITKKVLVDAWRAKTGAEELAAVAEVDKPSQEEVEVARTLAELKERHFEKTCRTTRGATEVEKWVPGNALGTSATSFGHDYATLIQYVGCKEHTYTSRPTRKKGTHLARAEKHSRIDARPIGPPLIPGGRDHPSTIRRLL